ncbi:MAG: bifunctional hydroxymethylpyrimidine kinase/phosphomethylpyrimidine kinase [Armatimonadota bacterium]|nr:bifunctional hydroxymethylpyrimidine kinase/phosphomethylpyrimidine kinase [Armatimonadota bacterium]MCX7777375.1 bifunctional hydroxymethylpyrimidine kinase/phosphomethylpyrimidine kinase [Armatimonadota bacterium]MDW8025357.1 bifunctional hydroxymethylpyrimidine kinase/phosphomethylpyrimidine kinase [Armatimonadota bacterium]
MKFTPCALTIAGSDSSGGAGVQADLKTFTALGVFGACAITALTAQNTLGVSSVLEVPAEFVAAQIDAVASDLKVGATKTGMLSNASIVEVVSAKVKEHNLKPLVVDPVIIAGTGARLLSENAIDVLKRELLPLATIVTPNVYEAEVLSGIKVTSLNSAMDAAIALYDLGASVIVIKGGHLEGDEAIDLVYDGNRFLELRSKRSTKGKLHGAGCVFSAAITAALAKGATEAEAIKSAKQFIQRSIEGAFPIGSGLIPVNPLQF